MTPPDLSRVLALLSDVRSVGHHAWFASCPAHAERTPSLSIRVADGWPGYAIHCFGCGAGTRLILTHLGLLQDASSWPQDGPCEPIEGSPEWWAWVHQLARAMARRQPSWYPEAAELAHHRRRVADWHAYAERLGPEDPAAWTMLDNAARLDFELHLFDRFLVPGLPW